MPPPRKKELILPSILLAGFITFFASGAHEFFSWQVLDQHYTAIKGFVIDKQWLSYLVFFCAYFAAVAFSLPIAGLLTLAGGAILGWPAATLAVTAATAGAGLVFFAARNLFSDILQRRAGPFLGKLEEWVLPKCVLLPPCPAPRSNSSVLGIKYRASAHPHGYGSISNRNLYWYNPGQFCVCLGWARF